jgi:hypothetical protein
MERTGAGAGAAAAASAGSDAEPNGRNEKHESADAADDGASAGGEAVITVTGAAAAERKWPGVVATIILASGSQGRLA